LKDDTQQKILEKYGGANHLNIPSKELLYAQTENYVEYSRTGRIIKGQEKAKVKSKYEEEGNIKKNIYKLEFKIVYFFSIFTLYNTYIMIVYINNHTTVWGSYWENGKWGYKCCHSFIKNSYCTGAAGIEAKNNAIIDVSTEKPKKSLLEVIY